MFEQVTVQADTWMPNQHMDEPRDVPGDKQGDTAIQIYQWAHMDGAYSHMDILTYRWTQKYGWTHRYRQMYGHTNMQNNPYKPAQQGKMHLRLHLNASDLSI